MREKTEERIDGEECVREKTEERIEREECAKEERDTGRNRQGRV